MFGLCEYLLSQAQHLDSQGRFACADIIDRLAQSSLGEQYPVLYHGTKNEYDQADVQVDQNMQGLYMTTSPEAASGYGDVRSYQVKPGAKVLDLSDGEELWQWMIENGILDEEDIEDVDLHTYVTNGQIFQYDLSNRTYFADDIVKTARYLGYDIVKIPDYPLGDDHTAWVATHSQILQPVSSEQRTAGFDFEQGDEYWIDNDGYTTYANGDIGDYNHEMIAEREILNRLGYDIDDDDFAPASLSEAHSNFNKLLNNADEINPGYGGSDIDEYFEYLAKTYGEEWKEYAELDDYLFWKQSRYIKTPSLLSAKLEQFNQLWSGFKDPRSHAIKDFGWYRLAYNNIETWTLTKKDTDVISSGLIEAYDEYADNMLYNIEVRSANRLLTGIPFSEIEDGSVVHRLQPQQSDTNMQQSINSIDDANQMASDFPKSDAMYQNSLATNYPDNSKLLELYRHQGASNYSGVFRRSSSEYSWYAFRKDCPKAFFE